MEEQNVIAKNVEIISELLTDNSLSINNLSATISQLKQMTVN